MNNEQQYGDKEGLLSITSLCVGIASIIFWEFSLIPILAILFGIVGLIRENKKWVAGIGLAFGIIFLVVRIAHGHIDWSGPSNLPQDASTITNISPVQPISILSPTPQPINIIQSATTPAPQPVPSSTQSPTPTPVIIANSDSELLGLINSLLEKYTFLNKVINLSLPVFTGIYQKQQSSIANLQKLQSISYRTDVANVIVTVQDESSKVLGIINEVKTKKNNIIRASEMLNKLISALGPMPTEESFKKFINNETTSADYWINMYDPKNPDNISNAIYVRDQKITELQLALFQNIKNTQ